MKFIKRVFAKIKAFFVNLFTSKRTKESKAEFDATVVDIKAEREEIREHVETALEDSALNLINTVEELDAFMMATGTNEEPLFKGPMAPEAFDAFIHSFDDEIEVNNKARATGKDIWSQLRAEDKQAEEPVSKRKGSSMKVPKAVTERLKAERAGKRHLRSVA